jgi:fatty acid desaturase
MTSTLTSTLTRPTTVDLLSNRRVPGRLRLKLNDRWYDLTQWQHQHPGGHEILQHLNNLDATDAFYSLHSEEAIKRLSKLYSVPVSKDNDAPNQPTQATKNFRKLRQELIAEGWFQRSLLWEFFYQFAVYSMAIVGSIAAYYHYNWIAIGLLGLCMQQAGWIGHDHTHGRGKGQFVLGHIMSGLITGFSSTWWSNKHNTHHVYTNYLGIDVDIENDPVFHLFFPAAKNDVFYRRFQHIYFPFAMSFLYISWKIQSLQYAFKTANMLELMSFIPGYIWLLWLGWKVSIASILLAGFLVAIIVTVTHQSEDMIDTSTELTKYSFVEAQFNTTRDAASNNPFLNWLWGGMQFQLEHHLFPTMPKYYYASLQPRIKQFAKANGIEFRVESMMEVWFRNFRTLKFFAGEVPEEIEHTVQQTNKSK